jgi:hypothetical protein
MKIETYEELTSWDFTWPPGDGPWELSVPGVSSAFAAHRSAMGVYWIGYAPQGDHDSFEPKYCGKAVRQSVARRLLQHVRKSSNAQIRQHLLAPEQFPHLWFRWVELPTPQLIDVLEGLEIAAFSEDYWNQRNEWTQHWALERDDMA